MMKNKWYIKKITVKGENVKDSCVSFKKGLNLIVGRSDTGKTWILECISFIFGSEKNPFSPETGYKEVKVEIETDKYGTIFLNRLLDDRYVYIQSDSPYVETGIYDIDYRGKGPLFLPDFWNIMYEISERPEMIKNSNYLRQWFSWKSLSNVFYTNENEIDGTKTIICPEKYEETYIVSSLIYILTGDSKPEYKTKSKESSLQVDDRSMKWFKSEAISVYKNKEH